MTVKDFLVSLCERNNVIYIENGMYSPLRDFFRDNSIQCSKQRFEDLIKSAQDEEYWYIFSMHEPLTYLRELLRSYYIEGTQIGSFEFFKIFYKKVNQYNLTKETDIENFSQWLANCNIRTVYDPQSTRINPRKNLKKLKKDIQKINFFLAEEPITDTLRFEEKVKTTTPFDTFEIKKYESYFYEFIEKDKLLYKLALNRLTKILECESIEEMEELDYIVDIEGVVDEISSDRISGWVFSKNNAPLNVVLLVNGSNVMKTKADRYRAGLHKAGKHPDGKCGFIFNLKNSRITPSDNIQIEVEETGELVHIMRKAIKLFEEE